MLKKDYSTWNGIIFVPNPFGESHLNGARGSATPRKKAECSYSCLNVRPQEVQIGIGWYFNIPDINSTYSSQIQMSLDVIAHVFLHQMITKPRRDCAG